jgi:hypothetical protein
MIGRILVEWEGGNESGKVLAIVQDKDLGSCIDVAEEAVKKMRGPGPCIISTTDAHEMTQTVVLIPDGEKPKWISHVAAKKDAKGQEKLKLTGKGGKDEGATA